jgi:hypothetical protein
MLNTAIPQNVQIPMILLFRIIEHLDSLDIYEYDQHFQDNHREIMNDLYNKEKKVFLRIAYSEMIYANSEDGKHTALINYLTKKSEIYGYPLSRR